MFFHKIAETLIWFVVAVTLFTYMTPVSNWYDAGSLHIPDFEQGTDTAIQYVGGARKDFKGSYSVVVRDSSYTIVSEASSGIFPYSTKSLRPDPLLLSWWAPANYYDIVSLPEGNYTMSVCWTVYDPFAEWGIPSFKKVTCIESNIFRIYERGAER